MIDNEALQELSFPNDLCVEIFAVKSLFNDLEYFNLHDVGLNGKTKIDIVDGVASFTGLKFSTTSYKSEGMKFYLVICLLSKHEDMGTPRILFSRISSPIFIDSRSVVLEDIKNKVNLSLGIFIK